MKYVLLGASRGLGAATKTIYKNRNKSVVAFSRSTDSSHDFSKLNESENTLSKIEQERPTHIIYFAGGGPYGEFAKKDLKDHDWAFRLGFQFPAMLLHQVLRNPSSWPDLQQICFVGSAVAESNPDPGAASYAAAKHALKGLITSIQNESHGSLDIRLFSPGYMDTQLLPRNAWPRQVEGLVKNPEKVAEFLVNWLESADSVNQHQVFE
jgi:short-subunit dehydrogenase